MTAMIERINVLIRYKDLLRELVVRDVKLKYRRSFLGYLWSILSPLLIMIVMTIVFSQMFDRGIDNFPVYLLTGSALFEFVNSSYDHSADEIRRSYDLDRWFNNFYEEDLR